MSLGLKNILVALVGADLAAEDLTNACFCQGARDTVLARGVKSRRRPQGRAHFGHSHKFPKFKYTGKCASMTRTVMLVVESATQKLPRKSLCRTF